MRMGAVGPVVLVALVLAGCGESRMARGTAAESTIESSTVVPTTTTDPSSGRLRVTQQQTSCCYVEGQISFLLIRDANGRELFRRRFVAIDPILPVAELPLSPGSYEIESYQQPCDGNCGYLDGATNQCSMQVEVTQGVSLFYTVAFSPDLQDCTLAQTDTPLPSPVPDEFALREPYDDCGVDDAYEYMRGPARFCFADANAAGRGAELSVSEPGTAPDSSVFKVYRTNADRSLDVFLPDPGGLDSDGPWFRYSCTGLRPDNAHGFVPTGCTEPIEIDH